MAYGVFDSSECIAKGIALRNEDAPTIIEQFFYAHAQPTEFSCFGFVKLIKN